MSETLSGFAISGQFTATGAAQTTGSFYEYFNITVSGTFTGTLTLQRSFDRGLTWHNVARDALGNSLTITAPTSLIAFEPENAVFYRLNCTAYTSGTAVWRISQ